MINSRSKTNTIAHSYAIEAELPIAPTTATLQGFHNTKVLFLGETSLLIWVRGYSTSAYFFVATNKAAIKEILLSLPFIYNVCLVIKQNKTLKTLRLNIVFRETRIIVNTSISTKD